VSEIEDRFRMTPEEFFEREAGKVYHFTAAHDDRYVWQEVTPQNLGEMPRSVQEALRVGAGPGVGVGVSAGYEAPARWSDFRRYRITGCAHRAYGPDGLCFTCGFGPAEI
jgi:hypothetical protein